MKYRADNRFRRMLTGATLLGAVAVMFAARPHGAVFAQRGPSSLGAAVFLSNGVQVHIDTSISGRLKQVRSVHIDLHVPRTVHALKLATAHEHGNSPSVSVKIIDDNTARTYDSDALVSATGPLLRASVTMWAVHHGRVQSSMSGLSNQDLLTEIIER